jgi:hypothetical protein
MGERAVEAIELGPRSDGGGIEAEQLEHIRHVSLGSSCHGVGGGRVLDCLRKEGLWEGQVTDLRSGRGME